MIIKKCSNTVKKKYSNDLPTEIKEDLLTVKMNKNNMFKWVSLWEYLSKE